MRRLISLIVVSLALVSCVPKSDLDAARDEVSELKVQLAAAEQRIEELQKANAEATSRIADLERTTAVAKEPPQAPHD
jgi:predicted  nucleic acid-binding Zn-ribbon protein